MFLKPVIIFLFCVFAVTVVARAQDDSLSAAKELIKQSEFIGALNMLRRLDSQTGADVDIRFLRGLAALALAERATEKSVKENFLKEAVSAFHSILTHFPDLLHARIEFGYALFLQGKDDLAKIQFKQILAANPPPAIIVNARRILEKIRQRKRWSGYFSLNIEQNNNVNSGITARNFDVFGLPFPISESSMPKSATGVSFVGGGSYQYPLKESLRWKFGADFTHSEFPKSNFDQSYIAIHSGPRFLFSQNNELSIQPFVGQRWVAHKRYSNNYGARINANRQINPRTNLSGRVLLEKTTIRQSGSDSIGQDISTDISYLFTPLLQGNAGIGGGQTRSMNANKTRSLRANVGLSAILPKGWTISGQAEWSRARRGNNIPLSCARRACERQIDRRRVFRLYLLNRGITFFGFSPQLLYTNELQKSNNIFASYRRNLFNMRLIKQF